VVLQLEGPANFTNVSAVRGRKGNLCNVWLSEIYTAAHTPQAAATWPQPSCDRYPAPFLAPRLPLLPSSSKQPSWLGACFVTLRALRAPPSPGP